MGLALASLSSHGSVKAAPALRDHGRPGLRHEHPGAAHHQTLPAEEVLQRGRAPRQHAEGHRNWCAGQHFHGPGEAHPRRPYDSADPPGAEKFHPV